MQIGVIGYACNTGIGSLIQDMKAHLPIASHFVVPHSRHTDDPAKKTNSATQSIEAWLQSLNVLLCVEDLPYPDLVLSLCSKLGVKIVCYVDIDWFDPRARWARQIALFLAPNRFTAQRLKSFGFCNVRHVPVAVDTDYFRYQPRDLCCEFLFNNGWGGYRTRKGFDIVKCALAGTNIPVVVNSQCKITCQSPNFRVVIANHAERSALYTRGQVYLAPTRWEGAGLHIVEALACGYPVVVTDGDPMREYAHAYRITASHVRDAYEGRFTARIFESSPAALRTICTKLLGKSVSSESQKARELAETQYSWHANKSKYEDAIFSVVK